MTAAACLRLIFSTLSLYLPLISAQAVELQSGGGDLSAP
jgi:hypothetical protein